MDETVIAFSYDLNALRLEYKTTCDALRNWPGGDPKEQDFLEWKKQEIFRALAEQTFQIGSYWLVWHGQCSIICNWCKAEPELPMAWRSSWHSLILIGSVSKHNSLCGHVGWSRFWPCVASAELSCWRAHLTTCIDPLRRFWPANRTLSCVDFAQI